MRKPKINKNMLLLLAMLIATMIMGVGYASIEGITGEIEGKVIADAQEGVFITDVEYVSDIDANINNCKIDNFLETMLNSTIELSKTNPASEIQYKVTVYNSSTETVPFVGVVYDDDFYDNPDIIFEITKEGFQIGQTINPGETKEVYIAFKYKNESTEAMPENTILKSYLNFKMAEPNRMVVANEGDSTSNYLTSSIPKEKIESIKFEQGKEPEYSDKIVARFDASEKQDESIIGYFTDIDNNGLYELTFVSEEIIYGNKSMAYVFQNLVNLVAIEFNNFSTLAVTSMGCMFAGDSNLVQLNLSNFDTSNVKEIYGMYSMFSGCNSLTELDLSSFNTKNVSFMQNMFLNCSKLTDLDVSNFDTTNVSNIVNMFSGCSSLKNLNVSNWNTGNVISMQGTFYNCNKLLELDVSKWDTGNVKYFGPSQTNGNGIFQGCNSLENIDVSNWNVSQAISMAYMFESCSLLTEINVTNWDTTNVTNLFGTFSNCSKLVKLDVSKWNTSNVKMCGINEWGYGGTFQGCSSLEQLDVSNWDVSNVTDMNNMFSGCRKLTKLDLNNWNTSNVTSMNSMFEYCEQVAELGIKKLNTSNVKYMQKMFGMCSNLIELDVSGFDTSNVKNMDRMFYKCNNLKEIDVSKFNTNNVTNFSSMFYECYQLTELDLSSFNISSATAMQTMFCYDRNLKTIYVRKYNQNDNIGWTTATVMDSARMFFGCSSITGGNGTTYDSNYTDATYARIDTAEMPGYFTNIKDKPVENESTQE